MAAVKERDEHGNEWCKGAAVRKINPDKVTSTSMGWCEACGRLVKANRTSGTAPRHKTWQ